MSGPDSILPVPEKPISPEPVLPAAPSHLRRFLLLHLPLSVVGLVVLLAVATVGLYFWASSAGFENMVRNRLVSSLESATGGRVEIASFHWRLLQLEAEAGGLVIHGLEAPGEVPYAQAEHLRIRLSLLDFWSPRFLLRDLVVSYPAFHLIVYRDGSTNQPHPRKPQKRGRSTLDTFFNLKAGHVAFEQGVLHYENCASSFDFQDRFAPLNFDANDVSLILSYIPASSRSPESYRIEAGAADLNLSREGPQSKTQPVHGYFQTTLDLTRTAAYLRSLRVVAKSHGVPDRTLELSGALIDFSHPRWQGAARGELDMRLLDPITGYPNAPEGIARLDLNGAGQAGEFRIDGSVHVDGGSYIGTGVTAVGVRLDAQVHADPVRLQFTSVVVRLKQGGQMEGMVALDHWLPPVKGAAVVQPASGHVTHSSASKVPLSPPPPVDDTIPVDGKVTAKFTGVSLDTLLDMVGEPPYKRLGFDTLLNGPAVATWTKGDVQNLVVSATLNLNPSGHSVANEASGGGSPSPGPKTIALADGISVLGYEAAVPGGKFSMPGWDPAFPRERLSSQPWEVPSSGVIDGTYTQRDGAVDLRKMELHTPGSQFEAHGHLGAYPLASPTAVSVDFRSRNLGEFDTLLRKLGLSRKGKTGVAALPVSLAGQAEFHGTWAGSLRDPHLAGTAKATQLTAELPSKAGGKPGQPQFVYFDAVDVTGSYSAAHIVVDHSLLRHGQTEIALGGTLDAAGTRASASFSANSLLRMHLHASKVSLDELLRLTGQKLPMTGTLDAQLEVDGPLHNLGGSGWVEMEGGSVYGEPVANIRAQGTLSNQLLKLASASVAGASGKISATGSYNLKSRRFQVDAKGTGIDMAKIEWLRRKGMAVGGKLGFSVSGSGTPEDPRLEGRAAVSSLTLSGEPLGSLSLTAHSANRAVIYDATSRLGSAEFVLHGQTALSGGNETQASLQFSRFDIGVLLKLAHFKGLSGESALAGTATIAGPLARPEQLRGEVRMREAAVTVSGVHLHSEGGVRASLVNSRIYLDPVHVIGEETDLRAQGSLALKDKQQLDFAASGSVNLKLLETLNRNLTASGVSTFQVEAHGPLKNPGFLGRIDVQNGALALEDVPNSLSQMHGRLEFNQNRLEVKSLTATSGGGQLSVGGYLAYQQGLYTDLSVTGKGVRIRYPEGVSSQTDATLRLLGSANNLLIGGNVLVTRFTVSPDLDIAALAAQASSVKTIVPPDAASNHIRLDVHLLSSPQLNFQNAYAKLAGDMDLHLRGTVASPSVLGRISVTEGSAVIAGTRYELQHGDIFFTNPIRIQPSIDLNASARVEDYDITLGLHGTPDKMAVSYRSDPPLPEADVVALLALGRTENQQRIYTQQQLQTNANPTTDALLGGALNATVSSRVQKLFGAGSVKVDPNYLGALGNSTSRIIVEEQLGRNLTLTYATNVNTTGQQLLQAEVAINRHVSLLVSRDESGVFSMVIKATRRYR